MSLKSISGRVRRSKPAISWSSWMPGPFRRCWIRPTRALPGIKPISPTRRRISARYTELLKHNNAPEQQVATQQATVAADEAIINSDKAVIDAARLNVEYASIRSPIDGITGIRQVDLGNLVQANSETLVVVTQIKPIYVVFPVPEADIPRVRSAMGKSKLQVLAYDAADQKQIAQGVLDLVEQSGSTRRPARSSSKRNSRMPTRPCGPANSSMRTSSSRP